MTDVLKLSNFAYTSTPEFQALFTQFRSMFGEGIPLMMIPESETFGSLKMNVEKCFAAGRDLLPEIYDMKLDGSVLY